MFTRGYVHRGCYCGTVTKKERARTVGNIVAGVHLGHPATNRWVGGWSHTFYPHCAASAQGGGFHPRSVFWSYCSSSTPYLFSVEATCKKSKICEAAGPVFCPLRLSAEPACPAATSRLPLLRACRLAAQTWLRRDLEPLTTSMTGPLITRCRPCKPWDRYEGACSRCYCPACVRLRSLGAAC
eukprot:365412-Chlamydomonas_euryale.AAC.18